MRVIVLYHPKSDHGGLVEDYAAEFERYKNKKLELVSLETQQGSDLAELYGIDRYPAILAISEEGGLQRLWQGMPMPLMDELSYYVGEPHDATSHTGHFITPFKPLSAAV